MKDKLPRTFALLAVFALLLYTSAAGADGLQSPRVFTRGANIYVVDSGRIVFLSMDTRSSHALYTAPDPIFSIVSVVQSGDMLWASNGAGAVMGVNMQAGTVEEYGRSRAAAGGHLDADSRYLWLAADDTLFRMDMVSREWVPIPIPDSDMDTVRAVVSFNDQVQVVSSRAVYAYRPISGDWVSVPHQAFVLGAGDFYRVENICYFTRGKKFYRYDPSKRLWHAAALRDTIRAVSPAPDFLLAAARNRMYQYNITTFLMEPHPAIPMLRGIRSVTRHAGRIVCALDKGLALYTSPFDFNIVRYPEALRPGPDVFSFSYYGHIVLYSGSGFVIYNHERGLWSGVPVIVRNREPAGRYAWDEDGAYLRLSDEYKSTLDGTVAAAAEGVTPATEPSLSAFNKFGAVNLRTEDLDGRSLDVTLDNTPGAMRDKSVYYKGSDSDVFDRASYGVQGTGMSAGRLAPDITSKGVSAAAGSAAKAGESDRSFVSASAGGGHIMSKTEWRAFPYDPSGVYYLSVDGNREIAASSVRMYIDGAALQGADYYYNPASRAVHLRRRDKSYPASIIQVSFSLTAAVPGGIDLFQVEPAEHYGRYSFAEGAISPRSWLSARAGVLSMGGDTAGPMVLASTPVEWRDDNANRSLLFIPEAAYDSKQGTHAAGVTLGARENRAFGSYKGYWAARDFGGIDRYNFENRKIGEEHDIDFGYDLRDDLRLGWRQLHRDMDFGGHTQFEMYSNYGGGLLPDVEIALSSRATELWGDRRRKETAYLRLSDLASAYLTEMSRIYNVGYDFSLTEYRTNLDENGRVVYGWASLSPISRLTFTGSGTYRANPSAYYARSEVNPVLTANTHGLPAGVDAAAVYSLYVAGLSDNGAIVEASKHVSGYVYPGEYLNSLDKFAAYLGYSDNIKSHSLAGRSAAGVFFVPDDRTYELWIEEVAGLIFVPAENLLTSTYNTRTRRTNVPAQYRTVERAKFWFESGSSVEGNLDIVTYQGLSNVVAGNSMYEHRWNDNLMAGAGALGVRYSENGAAGYYAGPQFKAALTKEMSSVIRAIENGHQVSVIINKGKMSKPNTYYNLYLRMKMSPNISMVGELQAELLELRDKNAVGSLYLYAGF